MTAADKKLKRNRASDKLFNQFSVLGRTVPKKDLKKVEEMQAIANSFSFLDRA